MATPANKEIHTYTYKQIIKWLWDKSNPEDLSANVHVCKIIVKNCEVTESLFYLQANKLASLNFMNADIRYDAPKSEIKNCLLIPKKALAYVVSVLWALITPDQHEEDQMVSARAVGCMIGEELWS